MSNKITKMVYALCTLVTASVAGVMVGSGVCYGGVTTETIELRCGKNLMKAQPYRREGEPHTRLTLTTVGIREAGVPSVVPVERAEGETRMRSGSGAHVIVAASCIPSGKDEDKIELTGTSLVCEKGEGLVARLLEPNDPNPDKFHYIGTLTIIRDDDDQEAIRAELARVQQQIAEKDAEMAVIDQKLEAGVQEMSEMLAKKLMGMQQPSTQQVNSTNPPPSGVMMLRLQPPVTPIVPAHAKKHGSSCIVS